MGDQRSEVPGLCSIAGAIIRAMPAKENVDLIRRIYDAINRDDLTALSVLFAPDMVRHDLSGMVPESAGAVAVSGFVEMLHQAIPDVHMEIEDVFEGDGCRVAVRLTLTGTHKGEFLDAAPSGKHVSFAAITLYRIEAGRVAEAWSLVDWAGALRQMHAGAV